MVGFEQDLRSAARQIVRWPGLILVTVVSLAGPMGLSTGLFSLFNAGWLRPWDVDDPDRVRVILPRVPVEEWQEWAEQTRTFRHLAAVSHGTPVTLNGRRVWFDRVSFDYFDVLGFGVALGHGFSPEDDRSETEILPAVVSHRLWMSSLDGDPEVVGRVLTLSPPAAWQERVSVRIVGVGPPGFDGTETLRTHLWLPLAAASRLRANGGSGDGEWPVGVVGRLAPGVSPGEAQAELSTLSGRHRAARSLGPASVLVRGTDRYSHSPPSPRSQLMMTLLLIGVGVIAFVACANVANLQLARGHARSGEIAVRLSLGATRWRIVRELLTEASLIALAAGLLGLGIAAWLPGFLVGTLLGSASPQAAEMLRLEFPVDARVFGWAVLVSTLASLVFGLAPALQCTRVRVGRALQDAHGQSTRPLKTSLLSAQAIVSVIALALAGLAMRSADFDRARDLEGMLRDVTVVRLDLGQVDGAGRRHSAHELLWERLESVLGSENVAGATSDPLAAASGVAVSGVGVSPGYFDLLGMPMLAGRAFTSGERAGALVVNEAVAQRLWPGQAAIGRALVAGPEPVVAPELVGRVVVGVVRDRGLSGSHAPVAYYPASAGSLRVLLARDPARIGWRGIASFMERAVPGVETRVQTGREWAGSSMGPLLVSAWATAGFGLLAVALGGLGFFTLSEYAVRQRTREIGVRVALGAGRRDVVRAILSPAIMACGRGLLVGVAVAVFLGFAMKRAQLPEGVEPLDASVYVGVGTILGLVALSASWVPARRALAIEPTEALRVD
jgi:predicted permease